MTGFEEKKKKKMNEEKAEAEGEQSAEVSSETKTEVETVMVVEITGSAKQPCENSVFKLEKSAIDLLHLLGLFVCLFFLF
ncbi:MAG TPA: hypothetical protein VMZ26_09360 [Pyrinomonadaceae bacterium]|nr:hypothetical protein [Pyrinomonadaceae bacterium]